MLKDGAFFVLSGALMVEVEGGMRGKVGLSVKYRNRSMWERNERGKYEKKYQKI